MKKALTNQGSLKALLYRELILMKGGLAEGIYSSAVYMAAVMLFLGSIKYGNLGNGTLLDKNVQETMIKMMLPMISLLSVMGGGMFCFVITKATDKDNLSSWKKFRRTLPVTPVKAAAVKTAVLIGSFFIGLMLSMINTYLCRALGGDPDIASLSMIMVINTAFLAITAAYNIALMTFSSPDKAGIFLLALIIAAFLPVSLSAKSGASETKQVDEVIRGMVQSISGAAPFMPIVIILIFAATFFAEMKILGRRES